MDSSQLAEYERINPAAYGTPIPIIGGPHDGECRYPPYKDFRYVPKGYSFEVLYIFPKDAYFFYKYKQLTNAMAMRHLFTMFSEATLGTEGIKLIIHEMDFQDAKQKWLCSEEAERRSDDHAAKVIALRKMLEEFEENDGQDDED